MLRLELTDTEKKILKDAKSRKDIPNDRITAVLLLAKGIKVPDIADTLGYSQETVRQCIKAYKRDSVEGLVRKSPPGRTPVKKSSLLDFLKECLDKSPTEYGVDKETWDSQGIIKAFSDRTEIKVSHDTVTRVVKILGYSYRRAQKSPSVRAPSKEEKLTSINKTVELIKNDLANSDAEIYCCDESLFTNEPYLTRGFFKKR